MVGSSSVPKRLPESITSLTRLYSTQRVRKSMRYNRHCLRLDCSMLVIALFVLSVTLTSNRIPLPSHQRITNNRFVFHYDSLVERAGIEPASYLATLQVIKQILYISIIIYEFHTTTLTDSPILRGLF